MKVELVADEKNMKEISLIVDGKKINLEYTTELEIKITASRISVERKEVILGE